LAALNQQRKSERGHARCPDNPLRCHAKRNHRRNPGAAGNHPRIRKETRRHAIHRDRGIRHKRRRLSPVQAHDRGSLLNEKSRHVQITSMAPSLMVTAGPIIEIVAPCPLLMVMPVSLTEMKAPVNVFSMIPPVGPGTSLMSNMFCSVVWTTTCCTPGGAASASAGTSAAEAQ